MNNIIGGYTWEGDRGVVIFFGPEGSLPTSAPWSEWEDFEKRIKESPLDVLDMSTRTVRVPGNVDVPIHPANFGEFLRVMPEVLAEIRQERARGPISYFNLMKVVAEHESHIPLSLVWPGQRGHGSGYEPF